MQISRVPEKGKAAVAVSLNADLQTEPFLIERLSGFSIVVQVVDTSGTLAGTLKLQASNNAFTDGTSNQSRSDTVWVDIPSSDFAVTDTDDFVWNYDGVYYEAVRIVWDNTAGQGTMATYFLAKE